MEYKFYLIESSRFSNDGTIDPVTHAVVYSTRDSLAIKILDFLQKHIQFVMDRDCESLDVRYLTESHVDSRLVHILREISTNTSDDISFDCPEWKESYRIRAIATDDDFWKSSSMNPNHKEVVLGVELKNISNGNSNEFMTTNLRLYPGQDLSCADNVEDPDYAAISLNLNDFSIEGVEW